MDMDDAVMDAVFGLLEEIETDMKELGKEGKIDSLEDYDYGDNSTFTITIPIVYPASGRVVKEEKRYRVSVSVKVEEM